SGTGGAKPAKINEWSSGGQNFVDRNALLRGDRRFARGNFAIDQLGFPGVQLRIVRKLSRDPSQLARGEIRQAPSFGAFVVSERAALRPCPLQDGFADRARYREAGMGQRGMKGFRRIDKEMTIPQHADLSRLFVDK